MPVQQTTRTYRASMFSPPTTPAIPQHSARSPTAFCAVAARAAAASIPAARPPDHGRWEPCPCSPPSTVARVLAVRRGAPLVNLEDALAPTAMTGRPLEAKRDNAAASEVNAGVVLAEARIRLPPTRMEDCISKCNGNVPSYKWTAGAGIVLSLLWPSRITEQCRCLLLLPLAIT